MEKEKEIFERNIYYTRVFAVFYAALSLIIFLFWIYPLLNTIYPTADAKYRVSWVSIFLLSLNFFLPILLLWILETPKNAARSDLYFIFIVIMLLVNIALVVVFRFYWLFYTNLSITGLEPFNDYRWCCVYYNGHPELCSNDGFNLCMPSVTSGDLNVNTEFILHWIASGVFFILTIGHWGVHRLLHITGVVIDNETRDDEGLFLGTIFTLVYVGVFTYWAAVPLLNTIYVNGYPRFAIPPSPNTFESTLYSFAWVMIFLLTTNFFSIMSFMLALSDNKTVFTPWLNYWTTVIVMILSLFATFALGGIWIFNCNYSYSGASICKSYQWCCTFFANSPTLCPNTTPCPIEPKLSINSEFLQHFIFSIIFWVFGGIYIWLNKRMKDYNVFYK